VTSSRSLERRLLCLESLRKYYSIAFALDYKRFEVYAKIVKRADCWRDNGQDDPVVHQIEDEDYNENPVLAVMALVKTLGG